LARDPNADNFGTFPWMCSSEAPPPLSITYCQSPDIFTKLWNKKKKSVNFQFRQKCEYGTVGSGGGRPWRGGS
jgi:hypothetical protein